MYICISYIFKGYVIRTSKVTYTIPYIYFTHAVFHENMKNNFLIPYTYTFKILIWNWLHSYCYIYFLLIWCVQIYITCTYIRISIVENTCLCFGQSWVSVQTVNISGKALRKTVFFLQFEHINSPKELCHVNSSFGSKEVVL